MAELDAPLRVDWVDPATIRDGRPGRLGLTFLPGKHGPSFRYPGRVYRRDLAADLARLRDDGVTALLLLVDDEELARWGDAAIVARAAEAGVEIRRHPIPDGGVPTTIAEMEDLLDWIEERRASSDVAVACMGGVGRTGTVVACTLVRNGASPSEAIAEVRRVRHPTAVETLRQEAFVREYGARMGVDTDSGSATVAP